LFQIPRSLFGGFLSPAETWGNDEEYGYSSPKKKCAHRVFLAVSIANDELTAVLRLL